MSDLKVEPHKLRNDELFNAWVCYFYEYRHFVKKNFQVDPITGDAYKPNSYDDKRLRDKRWYLKKRYLNPVTPDWGLRAINKTKRKVSKFSFERLTILYNVIRSKGFIPPEEKHWIRR